MQKKVTNKKSVSLYGGAVNVDFYPESHRYKIPTEKTYLISATAMTGILDKSTFLLPWALGCAKSHLLTYLEGKEKLTPEELYPIIDEAISESSRKKEEAGDVGSQIHDWCEMFAQSKIDGTEEPAITEDMDERVLNGISGFLDFYNSHDVKFLESERLTYSMIHGWCGITDLVAIVDGVKTVLDYKTGKYIYDEQYFQLGQYWMSLDEEFEHMRNNGIKEGNTDPIQQGMILHFSKEDGKFTLGLLTPEDQMQNVPVIKALFTIKKRLKELASKKPYGKEAEQEIG